MAQIIGCGIFAVLAVLSGWMIMSNRKESRRRVAIPIEERKRLDDEEAKFQQGYGF